jgi:hypothetical protein
MADRRATPGTCGRRAGRCSTGGGPWHAHHARRRCGSGSARLRDGGGVGESEAGGVEGDEEVLAAVCGSRGPRHEARRSHEFERRLPKRRLMRAFDRCLSRPIEIQQLIIFR